MRDRSRCYTVTQLRSFIYRQRIFIFLMGILLYYYIYYNIYNNINYFFPQKLQRRYTLCNCVTA